MSFHRVMLLVLAPVWLLVRIVPAPGEDPPVADTEQPRYQDFEREHWSFLSVAEVSPPTFEAADDRDWIQTPIDAFVLRRLKENSLVPSAQADRRTLIRRVTFDLTGLPPTPRQIASFLEEPSFEVAWERLVDRLLASPQYGVRWGQHWLDVIRFAESEGFEYDRHLPAAWMFRDYVIHAFNSDKPYDQFVREQIAGDEIAGPAEVLASINRTFANPEFAQRIAAGFHRLGPVRRNAGNAVVAFSRNEVLTERTDIIGTAFLGLSLGCARCHDHMFDAIRQVDYYRMQGFLASTFARDLPVTDRQTWQAWKSKTDDITRQIEQVRDELSQAADEEEVRLKEQFDALKQSLPEPLPTLFTIQENPDERTSVHVLERGDEFQPAQQVGMSPLGVLLPEGSPEWPPDASHPKTRLADWIADAENPLTARVIVNRIWQQHFGRGLVSTPNDFGVNGDVPSHPDLLDWLAREFIRSGWSVKSLHRRILTSRCYQQASTAEPASRAADIDPHNRLLWRFQRRRLSAEELRDAILSISGRLNPQLDGPSVIVPVDPELVTLLYDPEQWEVTAEASQHDRRSAYLIAKRNLRLPFLEVFDQPDLLTSCSRREQSTHPPQALELLNGSLSNKLAVRFAERLSAECGGDRDRLIERAFELTTGRLPSPRQRELADRFLEDQPLSEFALAMWNLNAFLYVD